MNTEHAGLLEKNRLLARVCSSNRTQLSRDVERVSVPVGEILFRPLQVIDHVYFPLDGAASMIALARHGKQSEVALFGREGFIVPAVALGTDRILHRCEVQLPLDALRITSRNLHDWMGRDGAFRDDLLAFVQVTTEQITSTTLANAVDRIPQRLARWLLMYHDRAASDDMALKHSTLGKMLSVRRPSISDALHVLEGKHMIRADRGVIQITDRLALTKFAGETYGLAERTYKRLIK